MGMTIINRFSDMRGMGNVAATAGREKSSPDGDRAKRARKKPFKSKNPGEVGDFGWLFGNFHGKIRTENCRR